MRFKRIPKRDKRELNDYKGRLQTSIIDNYTVQNGLVTGGTYVNVMAFGAKGDGSHDDTVAIQSAIESLKVTGGIIFFPPGKYNISSTLYVGSTTMGTTDYQGISLLGSYYTSSTLQAPAKNATFRWIGGTGIPVLQVGGAYVSGYLPIGGFQIKNVFINGNAIADTGIFCDQLQGSSIENVAIKACTSYCLNLTTSNTTSGYNTQHNRFTQISLEATTGSCIALQMSGNAGDTANCCHNLFVKTLISQSASNVGINLLDCDNNTFIDTMIYRASGSSYGVVFNTWARGNYFYHLEAGTGGVHCLAPNSTGDGNSIHGYDKGNGQPEPVLDTGANLEWTETGSNGQGWNFSGNTNNIGVAAINNGNQNSVVFSDHLQHRV